MIEINPQDTALLITDPQNDFLSPEGATWDIVGQSVTENGTSTARGPTGWRSTNPTSTTAKPLWRVPTRSMGQRTTT